MSYATRTSGDVTAGAAVKRFALCKLSSGKVVETTAATEQAFCVAQDSADADGDQVDAIAQGKTKVIAGAAVSVGDVLQPAADGKVIADDGATTGRHFCGVALEAASADGDIIEILLDVDTTSQ